MTTIHPSPPNLVPTISSGALPQTPASKWAENMKDVLAGHVTRTPVGTPGPDVPGGFPAYLEPDLERTSGSVDPAPQDTLLATAQSYMPSLATAKAYLPQAVAAYLPEFTPAPSGSESSLPPLPPSSASFSSTSGLPQDDTTNARHESYRTTSSAGDTFSTTAHTGHSSSAIAPLSPCPSVSSSSDAPLSPTTARPRATSGLLPSHPGVARESPSPFPSAFPSTTSASTLDVDAAADADVDLNTPQLVQSPIPLAPGESMDLALAAESSSSAPSSAIASADASASASTHTTPEHPRPTSGLLPSHPGVGVAFEPTTNVNAVPTASLDGVHPTPHAVPASSMSTSIASTPSLVPPSFRGGESGYAASEETESMRTPGPAYTPTPGGEGEGVGEGFAGVGAHGGGGGGGIQGQGSAALNSSRLQDNVPTGDKLVAPKRSAGAAPTGDFTPHIEGQGSAALNSGSVEDNLIPTGYVLVSPAGDMLIPPKRSAGTAPMGDVTTPLQKQGSAALNSGRVVPTGYVLVSPAGDMLIPPNRSEEGQEADDDASTGSNSETVDAGSNSENAGGEGEGTDNKTKKTKKPKLIQRLKERMHVGGGGGRSAQV